MNVNWPWSKKPSHSAVQDAHQRAEADLEETKRRWSEVEKVAGIPEQIPDLFANQIFEMIREGGKS